MSHKTSSGFLAPCRNSEKSNDRLPKKIPRQTEGWKDGQTIFYRTLPAAAHGPTSTTAIHWHLKDKDIEHDV